MLLKHAQYEQDVLGRQTTVHYLRTKDGAEVDFVLCNDNTPTHLIECKYADNKLSPALIKFASQFSEAEAVQLVRELRQEEYRCKISIARGAEWLAALSA